VCEMVYLESHPVCEMVYRESHPVCEMVYQESHPVCEMVYQESQGQRGPCSIIPSRNMAPTTPPQTPPQTVVTVSTRELLNLFVKLVHLYATNFVEHPHKTNHLDSFNTIYLHL